MAKYSTMVDVAFTVEHDCEDHHDIPVDALLFEMSERLRYLKQNRDEAKEAFGFSDTYEIQEAQ